MATVKRKGFPQIKRHLYVLSEKQNEKLSLTLKEFVKGKRYIKDSFGQMSEQAKEGVSEIAGEIFTCILTKYKARMKKNPKCLIKGRLKQWTRQQRNTAQFLLSQ